MKEGILVGCDRNQEWLLSWWWEHYANSNGHPVAFADFGMSEGARAWCKEKGVLISLPNVIHDLKAVPKQKMDEWESRAGSGIWPMRPAWFKKPIACLASPFSKTIWIDLDCEIKGCLDSLFHYLAFGIEIGLCKDERETYNSGVIAFRKDAEILQRWAEAALERNDAFMGDQDVLSEAIAQHRPPFIELPANYNWPKNRGPNPDAIIVHYIGPWKIEIIKTLASIP